jgi:hypothetical protein
MKFEAEEDEGPAIPVSIFELNSSIEFIASTRGRSDFLIISPTGRPIISSDHDIDSLPDVACLIHDVISCISPSILPFLCCIRYLWITSIAVDLSMWGSSLMIYNLLPLIPLNASLCDAARDAV